MTNLFVNVLNWIYSWLGNYGWSVVMFTLLIRLVLLPLDIKSKKSMRAISKIQPKMQALQKKYANDKEKLNQKTMELYRKEHVSPMAGCLPMLISLPILWIMFAAMRTVGNQMTVEMILKMKQTGALPTFEHWLWIKNVFQPDSFAASILPSVSSLNIVRPAGSLTAEMIAEATEYLKSTDYANLAAQLVPSGSFISYQLNLMIARPVLTIPTSFANLFNCANGLFILPLLAGGSQLLMTQIMNGKQTKEQKELQQAQQAAGDQTNPMNSPVMKWFFPLFSVWICATSNAVFAIYWMAANVIQIVQQLVVNWYFDRQDAKAAAQQTDEQTV